MKITITNDSTSNELLRLFLEPAPHNMVPGGAPPIDKTLQPGESFSFDDPDQWRVTGWPGNALERAGAA